MSFVLALHSLEDIITGSAQSMFAAIFNSYGYIILRPSSRATEDVASVNHEVLRLSMILGDVQQHSRSMKDDGISYITNSHGERPGFIGTTSREHPLHTDGPYLDNPPRIVAMHCISTAAFGGETMLCSGDALVRTLLNKNPSYGTLLRTKPIILTRFNETAAFTVLAKNGNGRLHLRYRYDDAVGLHCDQDIEFLYRYEIPQLLRSEIDIVRFSLQPGDTVIVDNTAVLHGRTAFSGVRCLARLWFRGNSNFCQSQLLLGLKQPETGECDVST